MRGALITLALLTMGTRAHAIRPFITDDARVVGAHVLQLETWVVADAQQFEHWILPAFGPTDRIELTIGAVHGANYRTEPTQYGVAGPLLQMKLLLHPAIPNRWPGVAVAGGAITPPGRGGFETPGGAGFAYLALTESLLRDERLLIHGNIGVSIAPSWTTVTWGVGMQFRAVRGFNLVAEIVYGDPYGGPTGGAIHAGFRYVFSDHIQLDCTGGVGIFGDERRPAWGSVGLRLASNALW